MIPIVVISLLLLLLIGVPITFAIGLSGIIAIVLGSDLPLYMVVQKFISGINSFSLMAVPLFILAGAIMGKAGISSRIVELATAMFSWMRGGLGIVCIAANMVFAGISGSGSAAISAVGGLTAPEMKKKGYKPGMIVAIIGGGGSLGPVIPPSIDMIVFASITGLSVGKMFLGGILPGCLIGLGLMIFCYLYAKKNDIDYGGKFVPHEVMVAFRKAVWALVMPLLIIGGVIGGIFTATEAGGIACVYGLLVGFFVHKDLKVKDLVPLFRQATVTMCQVMMIIGSSTILGYILVLENIGPKVCNFILSITDNPTYIMMMVIVLMLAIGCFMESIAAMPIILPIIYPLLQAMGVDMVQFGVVFCMSTILGGLTPPVGIYLFLSMTIAKAKMGEAIPYLLVVMGIIITIIFVSILFPVIPTLLPNLLMG